MKRDKFQVIFRKINEPNILKQSFSPYRNANDKGTTTRTTKQNKQTNKQKILMNERNNDHNKKGKKKTVLPPVALFRQGRRCGFPIVFIFL